MTTEAIQKRFEIDDRSDSGRRGLSSLPPIGRLGLVVLIGGWGLLVLPAVMAGAGFTELRLGATLLARLGESAIITGVALAVLALLVHMANLRAPMAIAANRPAVEAASAAVSVPASVSAPVSAAAPVQAAAPMAASAAAALRFETVAASAPPAVQPAAVAVPAPAPAVRPVETAARPEAASAVSALSLRGPMVVVARGQVDDRGFLILADGTLIIETLLGQRRFRTIADAREFIGGGRFVILDTVQIALKGQGGEAPGLKELAA